MLIDPHDTYRRHGMFGWTRIEMLTTLYDGAIERLEQAREALARNDTQTVQPLVVRCQLILCELSATLDFDQGELPRNLQRLYEFVLYCLNSGTADRLKVALRVLRTLREGLEGIRLEAIQLERSGEIPSVDVQVVQATV